MLSNEGLTLLRRYLLQFGQQFQRLLGLFLVQAAEGEADVDDHVIADLDAVDEQLRQAEADMAAGEMWRVACDCDESLVLAGDILFAGGPGKVVAYDAANGKSPWTGKIDGNARGLAVAQNRLFVSSDTGAIRCFGPEGSPALGAIGQPVADSPFPRDEWTPVFEAAAERIVRATGIERGYCLVLGCGTGRLAFELAKRTELTICGVEPDPKKVEAARKALDAAGLYGARVLVEQAELTEVPFSDYFANLVVSEDAIVSGRMPAGADEAIRMLKPLGGAISIGQPAAADGKAKALEAAAMRRWLAEAKVDGGQVTEDDGRWLDFRRGPLPGGELHVGRLDHQPAAPRHGVASVHGQVEEHLLELDGVAHDDRLLRPQVEGDGDAFVHGSTE